MKHFFITAIISFFSLCLVGQDTPLLFEQGSKQQEKNSWKISTEFQFASNALTNDLAKTYFLNGFISDGMKDAVSKKLGDKNRLGGEFYSEFYFRHKPDSLFGKTNLSWNLGFKNINHLNADFTRDMFEVYFRGNKNYAGKTADFSGFNYQLIKYQQFQFGLAKSTRKDSSAFDAGVAIGFNIGQQLLKIHSGNTTIYTADDGEFLDVNAEVEIHNSDSTRKNFGTFNGFGFSTDLFYSAEIRKKHFFFARISNLGFIRWNNRSTELTADSSFRFRGVDVSGLLNFADTVSSTITFDSTVAQPYLSHRKYRPYTLLLPAKIEFSYKRTIASHLLACIGAEYILEADYFPLIHVDGEYHWNQNLLSVRLSYGGYTTMGTGIYFRHRFHKGYSFAVGTDYLNSLFNLDTATSESAHISFYRNF